MYLHEIIWFLTAPVIIYISYLIIMKGVKANEKKEKEAEKE
jgi:hypothetical protein